MSFADAGKKIVEGTAAGLYQGGTIIMGESQAIVPVEFGTLKRSGEVEQPKIEGDSISVTIGYGYGVEIGPDGKVAIGYALYVHEIARYQHAPPTTYKYLERPARAFEPELGTVIEQNVRARLDGR